MENINIIKESLEILCKKCGQRIENSWNYCPKCKSKIDQERCVQCGNIMSESWKYCPLCKKEKAIVKKNVNISLNGNDWIKEILEK